MGPFEAIGSFTNGSCSACIGPSRSHRQSVTPICWANMSSWQNLGMRILGPYKISVQCPCMCLVGPYGFFVWQLSMHITCALWAHVNVSVGSCLSICTDEMGLHKSFVKELCR
jgi:hypothetical protein